MTIEAQESLKQEEVNNACDSKKMSPYHKRFLENAYATHASRYDYSKVSYPSKDGLLEIICNTHGSFLQRPGNHVKGSGCPECAKMKTGLEDFINRATAKHSDFFDYSKVSFTKTRDKVEIVCPNHGSFFQQARDHMRGIGCRDCANDKSRVTFEEFLKRSKIFHGNTYVYHKDKWSGDRRTTITCKTHGDFDQFWYNHTKGDGCQKCFRERNRLTLEDFVERSRIIHGDQYDYSKIEIKGTKEKVTIVCSKHGDFEMLPGYHYNGMGCRKCNVSGISLGEKELLGFIESLGYEVISNDRETLGRKEIDVLIPVLNVGFEYNGSYWHSEKVIQETRGMSAFEFHSSKKESAKTAGVDLYFVWENDWIISENLVKDSIKTLLDSKISNSNPKSSDISILMKFEEESSVMQNIENVDLNV